ncbi:MAG: hypothetical protein RMY28_002095 [Nostoc sp. ChiSLP01]|nr:hypothetical protein [Nostoc sp. CmiSLP01]MDZ8284480.1 hypothetical protein [Nostoc sp. ChiSLP01]
MSDITLEQEEFAVVTELDDEKTVALVGGRLWETPKLEPIKLQLPKLGLPALSALDKLYDGAFISLKIGGLVIKIDLGSKDK